MCFRVFIHSVYWVTLAFGSLAFQAPQAKAAGPSPLTYDGLASLIQERQVRSIDELLPLLPTDFMSQYTLMRDSESLQSADALNPRAIVYGGDGTFIMSFNGAPSQDGYDDLELIQYRERTRSFEFRRISFPSPRNSLSAVQFSEANPRMCLACHEVDPRPNWEQFSTWPGAYGEHNDTLEGAERQAYLRFRATQAGHPRYGALIPPQASGESPFSASSRDLNDRPNLKLLKFVTRLNSKRLARLLEKRALPDQLAIESAFLECPGAETVSEVLGRFHIAPIGWGTDFRRFGTEEKRLGGGARFSFTEGTMELNELVTAVLFDDWVKAGTWPAARPALAPLDVGDPDRIFGDRGDLDAVINGLGEPLSLPQGSAGICAALSGLKPL